MKTIIFAVVLCFTASCVYGQIEKSCSNDNECNVSNKFQCIQNKCRCQIGYRKGSGDACVLVLGTTCESNEDCDNFPGSVCDKHHKCICEAGFTAGNKECDQIGQHGDSCTTNAVCINRVQDDNIECKNNECICKAGFHQKSDFKCTKTSGFEDHCETNEDCNLIVDDKNALECSTDKVCKCKEGFKQDMNTCISNGNILVLSVPLIISLIIGLLKF